MKPININTHTSLLAGRLQRANSTAQAESLAKLATGQRINRAADDPSGLITSENLRAVLAALDTEVRSLQLADQVANSASGTLNEISGLINRAETAILANANTAGVSDAERQANQMELDSVIHSIDRITGAAGFNGQKLFDGNMALSANGESMTLDAIDAASLGEVEADGETYSVADLATGRSLNIVSGDFAEAQETVRAARDQITSLRGRLGSFQRETITPRLNDLSVTMENIASAESQVRDTDIAQEIATLSRISILHDSSIRNLGLVNSQAKNVLNLLG